MANLLKDPGVQWVPIFVMNPEGKISLEPYTFKADSGKNHVKCLVFNGAVFQCDEQMLLEIIIPKVADAISTCSLDGDKMFGLFTNVLDTEKKVQWDEVLAENGYNDPNPTRTKDVDNFLKNAVPHFMSKVMMCDFPGDRVLTKLRNGWKAPGWMSPKQIKARMLLIIDLTEKYLRLSAAVPKMTEADKKDAFFLANPKAHQLQYVKNTGKQNLANVTIDEIATSLGVLHDEDVRSKHSATIRPDYSKKKDDASSSTNGDKRRNHRGGKPRNNRGYRQEDSRHKYSSYGDTRSDDRRPHNRGRHYDNRGGYSDRNYHRSGNKGRGYGRHEGSSRGDYRRDDKKRYPGKGGSSGNSRRDEDAHHIDEDRRSRSRSRSRRRSRSRSRSADSRGSYGSQHSKGEDLYHADELYAADSSDNRKEKKKSSKRRDDGNSLNKDEYLNNKRR